MNRKVIGMSEQAKEQEYKALIAEHAPNGDLALGYAVLLRNGFDRGWAACERLSTPQPQPIETAPRNGAVLVWYVKYKTWVTASYFGGDWRISGTNTLINATHWLPLPPPPGTNPNVQECPNCEEMRKVLRYTVGNLGALSTKEQAFGFPVFMGEEYHPNLDHKEWRSFSRGWEMALRAVCAALSTLKKQEEQS
jgi:hypothetical protein